MAILAPMRQLLAVKNKDVLLILSFQTILLALFGIFARYEEKDANFKLQVYPMFQDVHVMIFIGFGYLMTFLKRYGFSAVGFNFLLAAIIVQWAIICEGLYELIGNDYKIPINVLSLLRADVASATVLISMGALLGNVSHVQLIIMGFIEIVVFSANSYLGTKIFKVTDAGDSIFVHAFGAYFGLAVSYVQGRKKTKVSEGEVAQQENQLEGSSYTSDLFAMIGTVFLWMFWPSFNSAELEGDQQMRAIINTYLSLAACCVASFVVSSIVTPNKKLDMVHIQNSTLAGGVAIGTSANLILQPHVALLIGINAGVLSVYGYHKLTIELVVYAFMGYCPLAIVRVTYTKLTCSILSFVATLPVVVSQHRFSEILNNHDMPFLSKSLNIHDTCGIHNLHGMPAILAGFIGATMAGFATESDYHQKLYEVFPARGAAEVVTGPQHIHVTSGDGRTGLQQAGYQILAVVVTVIISIISGLLTGLLIRNISTVDNENAYSDDVFWQIHDIPPKELCDSSAKNDIPQEANMENSRQMTMADVY